MAKNKTADLPGELLLFSLRFLSLVLFEQLLCLYDAFPKRKNKNIYKPILCKVLRNITLFFDKDQIEQTPPQIYLSRIKQQLELPDFRKMQKEKGNNMKSIAY